MVLTVEPATPARWDDVAAVFGTRGDPSRCWCAYLRQSPYDLTAREDNRADLRALVESGTEPGLLAFDEGTPVGWVSVGPRERYLERLTGSPVLRPLPGERVWSVLCFVVPRPHRGRGVATALLGGAVAFARDRGAAAVEGVPRDDAGGRRWADATVYTGTASMFARAGFAEIGRRRDRPVYRLVFRPGSDQNDG